MLLKRLVQLVQVLFVPAGRPMGLADMFSEFHLVGRAVACNKLGIFGGACAVVSAQPHCAAGTIARTDVNQCLDRGEICLGLVDVHVMDGLWRFSNWA